MISLGDLMRTLEVGPRGGGGILQLATFREVVEAAVGPTLWERIVVIDVEPTKIVLGAGGPALFALQMQRHAIEDALRGVGFAGTLLLVPCARTYRDVHG